MQQGVDNMRGWLKKIRLLKGMTQTNVALQVGISIQFYSYIESGQRRPSPKVARDIAAALGFSGEWYRLLDDEGEKQAV